MDVLLIAIGFTGALTCVWIARLVSGLFYKPMQVSVCFAPRGSLDVLLRELAGARKSIQLLAGQLACASLAEALHQAHSRRVQVEILLDPASETDPLCDLAFLIEVGLQPLVVARTGLHHQCVIIDGKTAILTSFPLTSQADTEQSGSLLIVRHHPTLLAELLQEFALHRETARQAEVRPAPRPLIATSTVREILPASMASSLQTSPIAPATAPPVPSNEESEKPSVDTEVVVPEIASSDAVRELTARFNPTIPQNGGPLPDNGEASVESVGYIDPLTASPMAEQPLPPPEEPLPVEPPAPPSVTMSRSLLDRPLKESAPEETRPEKPARQAGPMVTPAAAELIARLRKQLAGKSEGEEEQLAV